MHFTLFIIVGASFVLLGVLFFSSIPSSTDNAAPNNPKTLKHAGVSEAVYNYCFFPVVMGTLIVFFLMVATRHNSKSSFLVNCLCLMQMMLLSTVFFHEFKALLLDNTCYSKYCGVPRCSRFYIPLYLAFTLLNTLVLCAAFQFASFRA
jgi:hypothetical protein